MVDYEEGYDYIFSGERVEVFAELDSDEDWCVHFMIDGAPDDIIDQDGLVPYHELGLAMKAWVKWVKKHRSDYIYCNPYSDDGCLTSRVRMLKKLGFISTFELLGGMYLKTRCKLYR